MRKKFYYNIEFINNPEIELKEMYFQCTNSFINSFYKYSNISQEYISFTPDPMLKIISLSEKRYFDTINKHFGQILNQASKLILSFDKEEFHQNFPEHTDKYDVIQKIGHQDIQYARFDFLLDTDDCIKFCETNTHGGGGFSFYSDLCTANKFVFNDVQLPKFANTKYLAEALILKKDNIDSIGLYYSGDSPLFKNFSVPHIESIKLQNIFEKLFNLKVVNKDARCIENNEKHQIIFPRVNTNKTSMFSPSCQYKNFIDLLKHKDTYTGITLNGLSFLQDKSLFVFLYKYIDHFDLNIQNFIKKHIPYTLELNSFTFESAIQNQENIVLKPKNDARGQGVFIGSETYPNAWRELIQKNFSLGNCILQEKIKIKPVQIGYYENHNMGLLDMNNVLAANYFDGEINGYVERLSLDQVVNVSRQGSVRAIVYR